MLSAYKYRLYLSGEQEMRLRRRLRLLCNLYNELRAKKIEEYRKKKRSLGLMSLRAIALAERGGDQELQSIHSQVLQNVADRVWTAF